LNKERIEMKMKIAKWQGDVITLVSQKNWESTELETGFVEWIYFSKESNILTLDKDCGDVWNTTGYPVGAFRHKTTGVVTYTVGAQDISKYDDVLIMTLEESKNV